MSLIKEAVSAMKTVLLLEERIASQAKKLEQLAERLVEVERRLALTEGRMEGFFAGAAAFSAGGNKKPGQQAPGSPTIDANPHPVHQALSGDSEAQ